MEPEKLALVAQGYRNELHRIIGELKPLSAALDDLEGPEPELLLGAAQRLHDFLLQLSLVEASILAHCRDASTPTCRAFRRLSQHRQRREWMVRALSEALNLERGIPAFARTLHSLLDVLSEELAWEKGVLDFLRPAEASERTVPLASFL